VVKSVTVPLVCDHGRSGYSLEISSLPGRPELEIPISDTGGFAGIRLVEGHEYRFRWHGPECDLYTEPSELFLRDDDSGRTGRLRTGLSVGYVEVKLRTAAGPIGSVELLVRSRKLAFDDEYQWMLRDLASWMAELLMERFAASGTFFEQDHERDAPTAYQQFEFLRALLRSDSFRAAFQEILGRPNVKWIETTEDVPLGVSLRSTASTAKALSRVGYRPGGHATAYSSSRVQRVRTDATHDTTPNRFIKYALEHWLDVLGDLENSLSMAAQTAPVLRGRREVAALSAELTSLLSEDLFRSVKRLTRFPGDDQVLQKREGYRDVFRAFIEFELGAVLSWRKPSSFSVSSRDIATLYEYWAFVQLARTISSLAGSSLDLKPLLRVDSRRLTVGIEKGQEQIFTGRVHRGGRWLAVQLWFNRTYSFPAGSWSRTLRPDYSLTIAPEGNTTRPFEVVVLHFDAKYRVQFIQQFLGGEESPADEDAVQDQELRLRGEATPGDVMKMHAYRDAIRRTSGAYVLYPGGDAEVGRPPLREFHELLPGLGAFVLRPSESGLICGDRQLSEFLSEVFDHASRRLTHHERDRYWHQQVYEPQLARSYVSLSKPPANTTVLLGFVKSAAHWDWIRKTSSYNMRVPGRAGGVDPEAALLQCQLVLLYCPMTGDLALGRPVVDPDVLPVDVLRATGYPQPGGTEYWVVQLSWIEQPNWLREISPQRIRSLMEISGSPYGAPMMTTWAEINSIQDQ
jgi:predicted component of viral defense system (DUF524 family)